MKHPEILHSLTDIQRNFLIDDSSRFFVVPAGRRSRKTLIAMAKDMDRAMKIIEGTARNMGIEVV